MSSEEVSQSMKINFNGIFDILKNVIEDDERYCRVEDVHILIDLLNQMGFILLRMSYTSDTIMRLLIEVMKRA
jgi:hypothetical protein